VTRTDGASLSDTKFGPYEIISPEFHSRLARQIFAAPGGARPPDTAPDGRILVMLQETKEYLRPSRWVVKREAELKK
jgi:hypothetical protein